MEGVREKDEEKEEEEEETKVVIFPSTSDPQQPHFLLDWEPSL